MDADQPSERRHTAALPGVPGRFSRTVDSEQATTDGADGMMRRFRFDLHSVGFRWAVYRFIVWEVLGR